VKVAFTRSAPTNEGTAVVVAAVVTGAVEVVTGAVGVEVEPAREVPLPPPLERQLPAATRRARRANFFLTPFREQTLSRD
jgi:hypothetical protein